MIILGSGMAGLLAANILRRHEPVVFEKKASLPTNHKALLRFRTEAVSRATGIPFRAVQVQKAIVDSNNQVRTSADIKLSNMYAQKVSGRIMARSIMNLQSVERFIAPDDFIQQMAKCVNIEFNMDVNIHQDVLRDQPVISTMPMPDLMRRLKWPNIPDFKFRPVWVATTTILSPEVDVYQTIYFPEPSVPVYRVSIAGNRVIAEYISDPMEWCGVDANDAALRYLKFFGITVDVAEEAELVCQPYGKISPIDDQLRKGFIFNASEQHHIYSLGRFATWRNILLDDLIQDIQFIDKFIQQRDCYAARKSSIR